MPESSKPHNAIHTETVGGLQLSTFQEAVEFESSDVPYAVNGIHAEDACELGVLHGGNTNEAAEEVIQLPPLSRKIVRLSTAQPMKDDLDIKSWLRTFGIAVFHIGCKYHDSRDLVIYDASSPYRIPLRTGQFTIEDIDPTRPTCREEEVYGTLIAKEKALDRFLENALHADSPTEDRGAALCYCQIARKNGLIARLEMWKFHLLFKTSSPALQEAYAQNNLIICLNRLGEFESPVAHELIQRDLDNWCQQIMDGVKRLHELSLPSHLQVTNRKDREKTELHILFLLRDLYCVSGGDLARDRSKFNSGLTDLTPLDNLILYSLVCGVQTPTAQQFGTCNPCELQKALSRSRLFVKVTDLNQIRLVPLKGVQEWISNLSRSLPIAFPNSGLPPQVLNEFECRQVRDIQVFRAHTYHELPSLNHPDNNVLVLLVWSSDCHGRALRALHAWAISRDGNRLYWRLVHDLRPRKAPAQIMLNLVAFVSLLRLLPYGFDKPCSAEANYLWDFLSLLKGFPCNNIRAALEHMIWSVWMAISPQLNAAEGQEVIRILAHVVDPPESVSKCDDKYSKVYWERRFIPLLRSNDEALSTIPEILGKLKMTATSALSAKEETSTHIKSKAASDHSTQTEGSESSRDLLRRMEETGRKKRGC